MKILFCILSAAGLAAGQTTAYLRDSGTGSWITGASNTTPIVIQTALPHGHSSGQTVGIWNVVFDAGGGCGSGGVLQGRFKVGESLDATHYSIRDLNDADVPARGTWCSGANAGNPGGAQWEGTTIPYNLVPGMKGWLDGDNGTFTRQVAMGTHNGLVSLTVSGDTATVVTSFENYVSDGASIAVWNSGNSALDKGRNPYTVQVDSPTTFHFTVSGVPSGEFHNQPGSSTCGPSGNADCLRLSAWAFTGNVWWDAVVRQNGFNKDRSVYDGGTMMGTHAEPTWGFTMPGAFASAAWKFLVDQKDTGARDAVKYMINYAERANGVNFGNLETIDQGGTGNNLDFVSVYLRDLALNYAIIKPYLSADEKAAFLGKMFNDVTDAGSCNKVQPIRPGQTAIFAGGVITGNGTSWLTDPNPANRLNVGDAVYSAWPPALGMEYYVSAVTSDTTATVITRNNTAVVNPFQYWIVHKWQTGDCGALWWYGHWYGSLTHPVIHLPSGGYLSNTPYSSTRRPSRASNNAYTTASGIMALSLAAADDDPRAVRWLEKQQSNFWDYYLPATLGYTTGFQRGGSSYSFGRIMNHAQEAVAWLANSVNGFPSIDPTGAWVTAPSMMKIYGVLPDNMTNPSYFWPIRWGTETGANQLSVGDYPTLTFAYLEDWGFRWSPSSSAPQYFRNWITARGWWNGNLIDRNYAARLFASNGNPAVGSLDYRSLPPQRLFRETSQGVCQKLQLSCPAKLRGDGLMSRTGWTSANDTHVLFQSRTYINDHDLPQAGSFTVYKRGHLIADGNLPPGGGQNSFGNTTVADNILEFGGAPNVHDGWDNGSGAPAVASIERWAGTGPGGDALSRYVYAQADVAGMYEVPIHRANIHFAHLKKPGTEELVLRYVDVDVSNAPTRVRSQIHYPQNGQAGGASWHPEGNTSCPGAGGCADLNTTRWIYTWEDGLSGRTNSLTTKIFSPGAVTVTWDGGTYTGSQGNDYRVSIHGGSSAGATVSQFDYVEAHRVNASQDSSFTATALNPDPGWTGVETADKVALFSRAGRLQLVTRFQTTHAGTGQYLIAGLEAGHNYAAHRFDDGLDVATEAVADGDNTLYFEAASGHFAVYPTGLARLILGDRPVIRVGRPMQYDFRVSGSDSYTWTVVGGALPAGLSLTPEGVLAGVPGELGDYDVVIRAQSASGAYIDEAMTLAVTLPPVTSVITGISRRGAVLKYGGAGLDALQSCQITVSAQPDFSSPIESWTDNGGAAARITVVGERTPLQPGTAYHLRARCGVRDGVTQFTTLPPGEAQPIALPFSIGLLHAITPAAVQVHYGPSPSLGSVVMAPCDGGCTVTLPAMSDEIVYLKRVYLDAGERVIAESIVAPMIAAIRP